MLRSFSYPGEADRDLSTRRVGVRGLSSYSSLIMKAWHCLGVPRVTVGRGGLLPVVRTDLEVLVLVTEQ